MFDFDKDIRIDAKTFQMQLGELTQTMVEKVRRQGPTHITPVQLVCDDLVILLRYALSIYSLLFYLNADDRRREDACWKDHFGVTAMSLVRSLIDCLYNITSILENPGVKGAEYRNSGFKNMLKDLDELRRKDNGDPKWMSYLDELASNIHRMIVASGSSIAEVREQKSWPTLGTFVKAAKDGSMTDRQTFFKGFTHLEWRHYSALSHGAFEAFNNVTIASAPLASFYFKDFLPHEMRPKVESGYDGFMTIHLGRAAAVLLCIVTEIQAYARFEGANINERICAVWNALMPMYEVKEMYEGRYADLMKQKGILMDAA